MGPGMQAASEQVSAPGKGLPSVEELATAMALESETARMETLEATLALASLAGFTKRQRPGDATEFKSRGWIKSINEA